VLLNVVLPTVALRSLQVLGMWVKNGCRLLANDELQDKNGGGIPSRSHREQQRTATCVAPVVCSTRGGGFGSQ